MNGPGRGKRRLFIGCPVPAAVARALLRFVPDDDVRLRRTAVEDCHLTLVFLGPVAESDVAPLGDALDAEIDASAFRLPLRSIEPFPPAGGRFIVALPGGEERATLVLTELRAATIRAVERCGLDYDRKPFVPHVTLARGPAAAQVALPQTRVVTLPVDGVGIYESTPKPDVPRYRLLRRTPLRPGR